MTVWYSSSWRARFLEYGKGGGFPHPFSYATKQSGGDKTHRPPDTAVRLMPTKQPVCFTTERAVCDTQQKGMLTKESRPPEQTIPEAGFFLSVGSAVVKNDPQFLIASKSCEKQRKTAYFRRNKLFSGAAGRIRTADLILTKWLKAPKVLLSSAFGAFLFQRCVVFRAFRSIVSIRSFPRVGHGVGHPIFIYENFLLPHLIICASAHSLFAL